MIVVAIIGILAAIAIPNFMRFRLKAKAAESKSNLSAVRSMEIAYFTEYDRFVTGQDWTPSHGADPAARIAWNYDTRFSQLGFAPEGKVFFEYRLESIDDLVSDSFTAAARSDLDTDDFWSVYSISNNDLAIRHTGGLY
jgi:type IV pilus assembly protein PilA